MTTKEEQPGFGRSISDDRSASYGCRGAVVHHFDLDYGSFSSFLIGLNYRSHTGGRCYLISGIISADVNHY